ncbi:MAG: hypothetical protein V1802_02085 [Candidatus Aenigmatarchaeota archaeon]
MTETKYIIPVRFSVPQESFLSPEIDFRKDKKENLLRNMDCYRDGSLLIELANIFWGKDSDGNYISPQLKQSIYNYYTKGEWTADHVDYKIETPTGIVVPKGYTRVDWIQLGDIKADKKGDFYADGGTRISVDLPPDGWQVPVKDGQEFRMFHPVTGSPLATLPFDKKNEAIKTLKDAGFNGKDVSRFWRRDKGERTAAVYRFCGSEAGPFIINASNEPFDRCDDVGVRLTSRQKPLQIKDDGCGMSVLIPATEYQKILRKNEEYDKIISIIKTE